MTPYLLRLCEQYLQIAAMRPEGLGGARPVTLREIGVYLDFYPSDDPDLLIEHVLSIDREVLKDVGKSPRRHD